MQAGRLIRTLAPLRPEQVYGRLLHRLPWPTPAKGAPAGLRAAAAAWTSPVPRPSSLIGPSQLRLLNEVGEVATAAQWNDPGRARLWLYNLHYFDHLAAPGARPAWGRALVDRWIAENPPGRGAGWEPYPTSLRIVNWVKGALGGLDLAPPALESLALQARWLGRRLERHLLGNHLLANAKALVFAGLFFEGTEAEQWLATGLALYAEQLPEQILADGGHFERSPMYHAIIEEDLLDVLNLARTFGLDDQPVVAALPAVLVGMRAWLAAMSHPDGRIGFFNDAAFGIAAEPAELEAYAGRLGLGPIGSPDGPLTELAASGYFRLQAADAVALLDAAPVGPDYLPGHAHADTLSCELSLGRDRVLVNGGTSVYGDGPQRQRERSTAAHSTVEIDGEDSSEVWAGFRVGRRARVCDVTASVAQGTVTVSAAHDGYRWRPGRPIHRRRWSLNGDSFTVLDTVEGRAAQAIARFHLHPDVAATVQADGLGGELRLKGGRTIRWRTSAPATLAPDEWRPEFGRTVAAACLVVRLPGACLQTDFSW